MIRIRFFGSLASANLSAQGLPIVLSQYGDLASRQGILKEKNIAQKILPCNYCYNIMTRELKVSRIGNSKGIRLPATLLKRYRILDAVLLEEGPDSITLRPKPGKKLTWRETAAAMAREQENWKEFDVTLGDGLNEI